MLRSDPHCAVQIEGATFRGVRVAGQPPQRPAVQAGEGFAALETEGAEETRERALTGDGFDAEHPGDGGVVLQPGHARELVGPGEDAAEIAQRDVGGRVGVGAGGGVRQPLLQLRAESFLMQEVRSDDQAAVSGQPLIGEGNSDCRGVCGSINIQPHRLVRLPWTHGRLCFHHTHKLAKRRLLFQSESFRLRTFALTCAEIGPQAGCNNERPPSAFRLYSTAAGKRRAFALTPGCRSGLHCPMAAPASKASARSRCLSKGRSVAFRYA